MPLDLVIVVAALALVAALYSSVGHGGASGYLAVMAIAGFAPEELRPTALVLNIIVSSIATYRFRGYFQWRLFLPFVIASIPAAFLAGRYLHLQQGPYNAILGLVLLFAAWRLVVTTKTSSTEKLRPPDLPIALGTGGGIGLLSGMIGVGGGIFLSPLLILAGWAVPRAAAAVAAPFILVNSAAGLVGLMRSQEVPIATERIGIFAGAVFVAGLAGSTFGATRLDQRLLNRLLACVLAIAAGKMILTVFAAS